MTRERRPANKKFDKQRPSALTARNYFVEGQAALQEFLRFRPEAVKKITCKPTYRSQIDALLAQFKLRIPVDIGAKDSEQRAPVVAEVEIAAIDEKRFLSTLAKQAPSVLIALDHITDPRNLGAIVRSAAFFGVPAVLAPERRQVLLTGASVATAQGGFALCDLVQVTNLGRTLETLKEAGYWIIGADMDGEPVATLAGEYEKVVLVLGSEDTGMSAGIRDRCDRTVAIAGAEPRVESLNVSVATGILLHRFCTLHPPPA